MNVSIIVFDGYSQDVIKSQIISNLSDYFLTNRRRDLIPQSDLVKIIENVSGVDSVNVTFLSEDNEIARTANQQSELIGLDEMGDIVIGKNELPVIRGGWKDRNGIYYNDGVFDDRPGSLNIVIKKVTKQTTNTQIFQDNMKKIMNR